MHELFRSLEGTITHSIHSQLVSVDEKQQLAQNKDLDALEKYSAVTPDLLHRFRFDSPRLHCRTTYLCLGPSSLDSTTIAMTC